MVGRFLHQVEGLLPVLLDAFAVEVHDGQVQPRSVHPSCRGLRVPLGGLRVILLHSVAIIVHQAEVEHGFRHVAAGQPPEDAPCSAVIAFRDVLHTLGQLLVGVLHGMFYCEHR
ncbi:hypothetical protein AUQ37_01435 [Candidatus Methanomethylophilus sp. 1R26]|nr:hypothetical protein AUQ37_01435 [Candidatus Methanomethylophilus sp. 1R26]